jgi:hypothetical protein
VRRRKGAAFYGDEVINGAFADEDTLQADLLRRFARHGNMRAAIESWERHHGRPLEADRGLLLETEALGLAIAETVEQMAATLVPSRADHKGSNDDNDR